MSQPAIFLDRDGVINALVLNPDSGRMESPLNPSECRLCDGAIMALLRLQRAGFPLVLVSNQPNYALGKSTLETLGAIHDKIAITLIHAEIRFARFCYCLHHPKGVVAGYSGLCVCRKPSPWFLLRARDDFGYSLADSWMIGDQPTDIQCGRAAGTRTIRIASGSLPAAHDSRSTADYSARNLLEAVDVLLAHQSRREL